MSRGSGHFGRGVGVPAALPVPHPLPWNPSLEAASLCSDHGIFKWVSNNAQSLDVGNRVVNVPKQTRTMIIAWRSSGIPNTKVTPIYEDLAVGLAPGWRVRRTWVGGDE